MDKFIFIIETFLLHAIHAELFTWNLFPGLFITQNFRHAKLHKYVCNSSPKRRKKFIP